MRCPTIDELPPPPPGRTGWPWTEGARSLTVAESDSESWPRVGIVTPSLNQAEFLEETIRSVLLQGYPDLEYVIMDGGSSDGSVDIIRKYEPWLAHWVSEADDGQTQAINLGWARSTGRVLAYINSDDGYLPGAVTTAVRAWRSTPSAGMIYGTAVVVDEAGRKLRMWRARRFTLRAMLTLGNVIPQSASFYARAALESVGFLDERWRMIMDYDLSLRVGMRFPSVCLPETIATFRDHSASRSRTSFPSMAREVIRLVSDLDRSGLAMPTDWPAIRQTALSRVHYEWAMSSLINSAGDAGNASDAGRHLRESLRLDPGYALRRPIQTSYAIKEVLRRSLPRITAS